MRCLPGPDDASESRSILVTLGQRVIKWILGSRVIYVRFFYVIASLQRSALTVPDLSALQCYGICDPLLMFFFPHRIIVA